MIAEHDRPPGSDAEDAGDLQLLDKREAANLLRVSSRTVERFVAAGELTCVRLGNRRMRFRPTDLRRFAERHVTAMRASA